MFITGADVLVIDGIGMAMRNYISCARGDSAFILHMQRQTELGPWLNYYMATRMATYY
jgi:hypothetical protein